MNKLKVVILVETAIIIACLIFLITNVSSFIGNSILGEESYCSKYLYNTGICLLSPKIYTGMLDSNSHLILNFKTLKDDLDNYISINNLNISVYVLNLKDSASLGIGSSTGFEPASLNKLPVAMLILKQVEDGKLSLNTDLPINIYDRDYQSGTLYNTELKTIEVKDLLRYMLSESDNTAFRVLEEQITLPELENLSLYLDYYTKPIKDVPGKNVYQITPKSTANLFLSLYLSTDLTPEHSDLILSMLTNTSFNIYQYASIPQSVTIAQKYGSYYLHNESFFHDCGIMYVEESRIFYCVMTQGIDEEKASDAIGVIVNKIYKYILPEPA